MSLKKNDNSPRMLIVGARGFLGTFVANSAASTYEVVRGDRSQGDEDTDVVIDIADRSSVEAAFAAVRPDAVLLLAAISDIDRCQRDPELALSVNLHGAENIANACDRSGSRLLFTSTGAVFDGLKHGYTEEDPVSPISFYGETKAQAEIVVQAILPSALILRVSLVLGRTHKPNTNSLIDSMIRRWNNGEILAASVTESRNPIDAITLSKWMIELLSNPERSGIYNTGSTDSLSRYALARAIADHLQTPTSWVEPELQPKPDRAPRGRDHFLIPHKISKACTTQPPSCLEVIERSLNEVAEGSLRTGV